VFQWLQQAGGVAPEEMYRTFNCGIGMIICVPPNQKDLAIDTLNAMGETVWQVGVLETAEQPDQEPEVRYAPGLLSA
jgi:phosphoribosylformylglycinamidine cyclo-ligase